jgi:hypothetical protein
MPTNQNQGSNRGNQNQSGSNMGRSFAGMDEEKQRKGVQRSGESASQGRRQMSGTGRQSSETSGGDHRGGHQDGRGGT